MAFLARLGRETDKSPEAKRARALEEAKNASERATALMAADPRLGFAGAITMAGDLLAAERSKRWLAEGCPVEDAMVFVGSYGRLAFAVWAVENGYASKDWLLDALPDVWSGSDPDDGDPRFEALWVEAWERNGRAAVLQNPEKALPRKKMLHVYRGQDAGAPLGIAWSLDRKVAEKFARGAATRQSDRCGVVIEAMVHRDRVLGFCSDRGEAEVILPVEALAGARRMK